MADFKVLVVYYSRSGMTRRVAEAIARSLNGDLEQITERSPREGIFGYIRSLVQARNATSADIEPTLHDVSRYNLVIVGTPVWGWSMSSPVRTYLAQQAAHLPCVAFFCTYQGSGAERALGQMEAAAGKAAIATCAVTQSEIDGNG